MKEMWKSAIDNASDKNSIEVIFCIDDDDIESIKTYKTMGSNVSATVNDRGDGNMSMMWNKCFEFAKADIVMQCSDDMRFRTKDWDKLVLDTFDLYDDKMVLVYGSDGNRKDDLATYSFVHRKWCEVTGYFCAPYFTSDWNDYWLTDVAKGNGRNIKLPNLLIEHLHPSAGKHEWDETHLERLARGKKDRVKDLYKKLNPKKLEDAEKIRKYISDFQLKKNESTWFDTDE